MKFPDFIDFFCQVIINNNVSNRIHRVNSLLKDELSQILLKEIEITNGLLTITRVETSSDLLHARVYISILPAERAFDILKLLQRRIYGLQQKLNKRLAMRPIPKIRFVEEKATKKAADIEELIEGLKNKGK